MKGEREKRREKMRVIGREAEKTIKKKTNKLRRL